MLRSGQPLEDSTRSTLAAAFEGKKSAAVHLYAKPDHRSDFLKKFRKRLVRLWRGKRALKLEESIGYQAAVSQVASVDGVSPKTVEAAYTFARKVAQWVDCQAEVPANKNASERELEIAYIYAEAASLSPSSALKQSLPELRKLINDYEALLRDSVGAHKPWEEAP